MKNAIEDITGEVVDQPLKIEKEFIGTAVNFGENKQADVIYPDNFYNGCGSYHLAFIGGKLVASQNFTAICEKSSEKEMKFFSKKVMEKFNAAVDIIEADGSGYQFFARNEKDVPFVETKVYFVRNQRGGQHKNIEIILS